MVGVRPRESALAQVLDQVQPMGLAAFATVVRCKSAKTVASISGLDGSSPPSIDSPGPRGFARSPCIPDRPPPRPPQMGRKLRQQPSEHAQLFHQEQCALGALEAQRAEDFLCQPRYRRLRQVAAMTLDRRRVAGSISKSSLVAKRTARIILTGSSRIRTSGSPTCGSAARAGRVPRRRNRSLRTIADRKTAH